MGRQLSVSTTKNVVAVGIIYLEVSLLDGATFVYGLCLIFERYGSNGLFCFDPLSYLKLILVQLIPNIDFT